MVVGEVFLTLGIRVDEFLAVVFEQGRREVPRVLFLGMCLDFHSLVIWVASRKLFFYFCRRTVAEALVKP